MGNVTADSTRFTADTTRVTADGYSFTDEPPPTVNIWSADGLFGWTADGFPGWSADGYEPNPVFNATIILAQAGLSVGAQLYQYSPTVPRGWVIGVIPGVGAPIQTGTTPQIEQNTVVNLIVSNGIAPPVTNSITPAVVGMYYYDAQLAILDAGMLIAPPIYAFSPMFPVIPTFDSQVITFDSTRQTWDESGTFPQGATFDMTTITWDNTGVTWDGLYRFFLKGYVMAQSLGSGLTEPPQTTMKITVSKGPPPYFVPPLPLRVPVP